MKIQNNFITNVRTCERMRVYAPARKCMHACILVILVKTVWDHNYLISSEFQCYTVSVIFCKFVQNVSSTFRSIFRIHWQMCPGKLVQFAYLRFPVGRWLVLWNRLAATQTITIVESLINEEHLKVNEWLCLINGGLR